MPPRLNRMHPSTPDRQRTWGTRYDTLVSPPPQEKLSVSSPLTNASPRTRGVADPTRTRVPSHDLWGASNRTSERRDWADDEVALSPSPRSRTTSSTAGGTPLSERQPHSASIFVGSLPPDADEHLVAQPLRDHLAAYASIRDIKIIRDSKGGLCAFVQCENPAQAVQLVSQAQAHPKPFLGRLLRFETAKARRTLLISYRAPKVFVPCVSEDDKDSDVTMDGTGVRGRWVDTDLPDALRIWKPRQSRYPIVSYRGEARKARDRLTHGSPPAVGRGQAFQVDGVFFPELKCDTQTIRSMAEAFGPLEIFRAVTSASAALAEINVESIPIEHRSTRPKNMEDAVWEVKWGHRDDCVTAYNTMKTIAHLVVTWARDSQSTIARPDSIRGPHSRGFLNIPLPLSAHTPSIAGSGRPLLLHGSKDQDGVLQSPLPDRSPSLLKSLPADSFKRKDETDDGWTFVRNQPESQNITNAVMSFITGSDILSPALTNKSQRSPDWKDGDFPPLDINSSVKNSPMPDEEPLIGPAFQPVTQATGPLEPPASESQLAPNVMDKAEHDHLQPKPVASQNAHPRPHFSHRRSLSNPIDRFPEPELTPVVHSTTHHTPASQVLEIPPTPELTGNSIVDTPTSAQHEPCTPSYPNSLMPLTVEQADQKTSSNTSASLDGEVEGAARDFFRRQMIDTKAIFVGGLETNGPGGWNEAKLRSVFSQYGPVLEIRLMIPNNKKTSFAFITFGDEQGPIKAVQNEHNRQYGNRPIRVQMRDMFPPRGGYGNMRGRGSFRRPNIEPRALHYPHRIQAPLQDHRERQISGGSKVFDFASAHLHPVNVAAQQPARFPHAHPSQPSSSLDANPIAHSGNTFDLRSERNMHGESDAHTALSLSPPQSQHGNPHLSLNSIRPQAEPPTPVPGLQQPMGYYTPQGWVPYGPQFTYVMPYGAYGGVVPPGLPGVPPMPQATQAPDSATSPNSAAAPWNGNAPYPFVPYHYVVVPNPASAYPSSVPMTVSSQTHSPGQNQPQSQPPPQPTGFVQGEHGMLVPVYGRR